LTGQTNGMCASVSNGTACPGGACSGGVCVQM
jgi:hypothetical protein